MATYQKKLKENIKEFVNRNNLEVAKEILQQYEGIVNDDIDIYSIKSVIAMIEGNMDEAKRILKKGLDFDPLNCDLLYNLAYLYEAQENYIMAYRYYEKIIKSTNDEIGNEAREKITKIEELGDVKQYKEEQAKNTEDHPVITIVTWAYNAEKYIEQCAESVLNQSFKDFEWIILDNGCTDKTSDILQKYLRRDKRIRLFKNKKNSIIYNEPHTPAYNGYINNLKSQYMCHLDSDDYLHPDFLKELYSVARKHNADIAVGGTEMFHDENPEIRGNRCPPDFYVDDITKIGDIFPQIYGSFRPIWGKLINTSISLKSRRYFVDNNVKMLNGADTMTCLYHLKFSRSVVSINKVLHYYRIRNSSHYHSQINKNRYLDYLKIYDESERLLKKWDKINETNLNFIANALFYSMKDCINIAANAINTSIEDRIEVITVILSDENVRRIINKGGLLINLLDEAIRALNFIMKSNQNRAAD